jgi:hypothetical protein
LWYVRDRLGQINQKEIIIALEMDNDKMLGKVVQGSFHFPFDNFSL